MINLILFLFLSLNTTSPEIIQTHSMVVDSEHTLFNNWKIIKIKGLDKVSINPTIEFKQEESGVSGFAGCNSFNGSFELKGKEIKFGPIASTRKMCQDMSVEDQFTKILTEVARYEVVKRELYLYDVKDEILIIGVM